MTSAKRRDQDKFRFTAEPDERFCASAFCRAKRLKTPTHAVTIGKLTYLVCASCARPWESVRTARVERIAEAANG